MRTPASGGTAPTVAATANNPASGATGALPVGISTAPPSTTSKFVSSSQADNIFGRIRKACSVKTKFATSSLKHSIQSSPTPPSQTSMTTGKSKESKVHNGRDKSAQMVGESTSHQSNTGPVITGAVTKLPPASGILNCSPSKQLLNSLFEPEQKLNNQHYQATGHYAHLMPPPHQHRHYGAAFYLDPTTGVPMQAPSVNPTEKYTEGNANLSQLRQSTSHDSLLNVTLRKKKKDSLKTSASGHSSPRHSAISGGNNGANTATTPRQLNNYAQPTDTADLARKEGARQDFSNHSVSSQASLSSLSNCSPYVSTDQSSCVPAKHCRDHLAIAGGPLSSSTTGECCKRCHGYFNVYQPSGSSGATEQSTSALTTVPSDLLSSARYDDSTDGAQYTDQLSLDSSSVSWHDPLNPSSASKVSPEKTTPSSLGQTSTSTTSSLRTLYNNIGPSKGLFLENLRHSHAQLGSQAHHNLNDVSSHKESNVSSSKLYYKPFTLAPKMRRSISKDSIDDKYWDLDDYLKNGNLKNLHAMNQVRDNNLKNQNHEYNNIHQYILQIQKEKQELQNQLVSLVANADAKRLEIEKLQIELKQVKEKYVQSKREESRQDGGEEASAPPKVDAEADEVKKGEGKLLEERLQCEARSETEDKVNQEFEAQPGTSGMSSSSFEWDKQSSSSISELSVANLQDRINQMEETHYSTSEELQATLQELNDMHAQVTELQISNEQLELEKSFLYETLCTQTKKLESYQARLDQMQRLILEQYESEEKRVALTPTEREEHLVQMLRQCQTDRDQLAAHKVQLEEELDDLKRNFQMERDHLDFGLYNELFLKPEDRVTSELYHYPSDFDKKSTEGEVTSMVEELDLGAANATDDDKKSDKTNEMAERLPIKLHSAKSLQEISHTTAGSFHSLDGLATRDPTTNEDTIEMLQFLVKQLQDRIAQKEADLKKLKERIILMESEHKDEVTKFEVQLKNIENRNKELNERNEELYQRLRSTEEAKIESEIRAQKNLDEKREIRTVLEEKDRRLADLEMRLSSKSKELSELDDKVALEQAEWKQFQQDLLTTVRVANDFKHEAMAECKKLQSEKHWLEEKLIAVEAELHKYKNDNKKLHLTLRANASNGSETGQTNTTNCSVSSVSGSTVKSAELGSSASSTVKSPMGKTPPSGKTSLLTMRMQSYDPPGNTPPSMTTSPSRTLSRSNSSQISVRSLIESIESHSKQKQSTGQSPSQPSNSPSPSGPPPLCNRSNSVPLGSSSTHYELIQRHLRLDSNTNGVSSAVTSPSPELRSKSSASNNGPTPTTILKETSKSNGEKSFKIYTTDSIRPRSSELADNKKDPLSSLVRGGGSKRNALLKWCTNKTIGYRNIDITNFSSSWNDGMAFCAILHTYLPEKIPYETLSPEDKQRNFTIAFKAAESVGISTTLDLNEMLSQERPDWHKIMAYVTSIYTHFEM